ASVDGNGNPIQLDTLRQMYTWSGANVSAVSGGWTRTDGGDAGFGYYDTDFTAAKSGNVNAGNLTIQSDPAFDGVVGGFYWHNHLVTPLQNIARPVGGWTSEPSCPA